MKEPLLHLEGYYIRELSVVLNGTFADKRPFGTWSGYHYHPEKSIKMEPPQFQVKSEIGRKIGDPSRWRYELTIRSSGRKDQAPYTFRISLVGYFHVHVDGGTSQDERRLVFVNAPSVLFAAAREALASATARGPYPAVILPLVSFVDGAEALAVEGAKRIEPRALTTKSTPKQRKKVRSKKAAQK